MKTVLTLLILVSLSFASQVHFEVLGSGGPEIDGRASASYIVWIDGKSRLLIDAGSGSMLGFEKSGARLEDLEAIVLTHMHIDHSVDLPSYIKAGYFSRRSEKLPIIGPYGNRHFPDIEEFLDRLFGSGGVYEYMSDVLDEDSDSFEIYPIEVDTSKIKHIEFKTFSLDMTNVHHGNVPALAVRVNIANKSILVSGDTNNENRSLEKLAQNVDLFVAHHAIPEFSHGYATQLHMMPSEIAKIAQKSHVKRVLLTHRMRRTIGKEQKSLKIIKDKYKGRIEFADDRTDIKL